MDLSVNNGPSESTALPSQNYDVLRADSTNETIALLKRETARTAAPDRRDRIELAGIDFHWPNASLVHQLDNTLGYNPLRLGLYSKATGAGDHVALPDQRTFSPLMPGYRSLLADMLGLRFIATGVPAEQIDKTLKPGDLVQIARTRDAYVYENPRALPRVLFVAQAEQADFDAILASGQWPEGFDPRTDRVVGASPTTPARPGRSGRARSASSITARRRYAVGRMHRAAAMSCSMMSGIIGGRSRSTASPPSCCAPMCCSARSLCHRADRRSGSSSARSRGYTRISEPG